MVTSSRGPRRTAGRLEEHGEPAKLAPHEEPPATTGERERRVAAEHGPDERDTRPALGTRGGPAPWQRADADARVALAREDFGDAQWSYLYKSRDTEYAATEPAPGQIPAANRRMRGAPVDEVHGPFIKAPVWTWEVPLYFWVGGVASGSAFVAAACAAAGDERSAVLARRVALAAVAPAPLLLIADLGRPERFLNMLRIVKPRSPMNLGAWCLVAFSATAAGGVGADLLHRRRLANGLGASTAVLGGYLGSYTGVLLASTAVPLWARSRGFLGPIFVCTATATGAALVRLTLVALGLPEGHGTRKSLRLVETTAILAELALSSVNERRLGRLAAPLRQGTPGRMFRVAQTSVLLGLAAQAGERRIHTRLQDAASLLFLGGGLAFRYAWVYAGRESAVDHEAVAATGRGQRSLGDADTVGRMPRAVSVERRPLPAFAVAGGRLYGELIRRTSLGVERLLGRAGPGAPPPAARPSSGQPG